MSKSSQAKERIKNNQAKQNQAVNGKPKSKKYYAKAGEVWSINDAKTRGHKSLITKRKKSEPEKIEHIPITHSPKTRNIKNIELQENPELNKDEKSYILPTIQKSKVKDLGKKQNDIQIKNLIDKSIIRHIKKKNKKKQKKTGCR